MRQTRWQEKIGKTWNGKSKAKKRRGETGFVRTRKGPFSDTFGVERSDDLDRELVEVGRSWNLIPGKKKMNRSGRGRRKAGRELKITDGKQKKMDSRDGSRSTGLEPVTESRGIRKGKKGSQKK